VNILLTEQLLLSPPLYGSRKILGLFFKKNTPSFDEGTEKVLIFIIAMKAIVDCLSS